MPSFTRALCLHKIHQHCYIIEFGREALLITHPCHANSTTFNYPTIFTTSTLHYHCVGSNLKRKERLNFVYEETILGSCVHAWECKILKNIMSKRVTYYNKLLFLEQHRLYRAFKNTIPSKALHTHLHSKKLQTHFYIIVLYSTRMNHQFWYKSNYSILNDVFGISPINICPLFTFNYIAHK